MTVPAPVLVALASVVFWATGALPVIAALIGAVLGVLTSVVLARVVTTGLGGLMGGRRFRDSAAGIVAVLASLSGVTVAMGMEAVRRTPNAADLVGTLAGLAGWTPFGWAWSLPWLTKASVGGEAFPPALRDACVHAPTATLTGTARASTGSRTSC